MYMLIYATALRTFWRILRNAKKYRGWVQIRITQPETKNSKKQKKRDRKMQVCTHLSRFALVSRVFPGRYAKKYTGYCIIACVPICVRTPVFIQFGVSYLQAGWVQSGFRLCKPHVPIFFCRIHPVGRCEQNTALV